MKFTGRMLDWERYYESVPDHIKQLLDDIKSVAEIIEDAIQQRPEMNTEDFVLLSKSLIEVVLRLRGNEYRKRRICFQQTFVHCTEIFGWIHGDRVHVLREGSLWRFIA